MGALVEERGFETVLAMVEAIGAGSSFQEALEEEAGMNLEEYVGLLGGEDE